MSVQALPSSSPLVVSPIADVAPDGFTAWAVRLLGAPRSLVVMPALVDDAPASVVDRVVALVTATSTGRCPLCAEVASEPAAATVGGSLFCFDLAPDVRHSEDCPALFDASDARWFVLPVSLQGGIP